jgi:hypothetical protein
MNLIEGIAKGKNKWNNCPPTLKLRRTSVWSFSTEALLSKSDVLRITGA